MIIATSKPEDFGGGGGYEFVYQISTTLFWLTYNGNSAFQQWMSAMKLFFGSQFQKVLILIHLTIKNYYTQKSLVELLLIQCINKDAQIFIYFLILW